MLRHRHSLQTSCIFLASDLVLSYLNGDTAGAQTVRHPRCEAFGSEFYAQAERDFEPFHSLTELDMERTKYVCKQQGEACFTIQIHQGQLYVLDEQPGFQSRNRLTMVFLQRIAAKFGPLPDAEFVVDTSDGFMDVEAPLFIIAKFPKSRGGILYPDFSSYSWPESVCPGEAASARVWSQIRNAMAKLPSWPEREDVLFWRGAPTSVYRQQVVPHLAALPGENVSFLEWVVGPEGQRQTVRSGSCVPLVEWCRYRFLANLPGNTMALALKYRLLCGSVVVSPPFWYHEWYYSQLQAGLHYIEVDAHWLSAVTVLEALRANADASKSVGSMARDWALRHLSEDGFDCYWLRLIQLASLHFPHPPRDSAAIPVDHAVLTPARGYAQPSTPSTPESSQQAAVDVVIVIPARGKDNLLMNRARQTWLWEGAMVSSISQRHFFVLSKQDPDIYKIPSRQIVDASFSVLGEGDALVVACPHGYTWLLQKMALAYRWLLSRLVVMFFVRADIDSVLPLRMLFPLMQSAMLAAAVVPIRTQSPRTCSSPVRWQRPSVGALACQTQCSVDRGCFFFAVSDFGECMTFASCAGLDATDRESVGSQSYDTFEYRLRSLLPPTASQPMTGLASAPFILGTILLNNAVFKNDTFNPQWNNPRYIEDLGLTVYPPYPEASGYAMTAAVAAFLATVGTPDGILEPLSWKAWAIEDAAFGTILAGLDVTFLQLPAEVRDHIRVIRLQSMPDS